MRLYRRPRSAGVARLAGFATAAALIAAIAAAQEVPPSRKDARPLAEVLAQIGKSAGVTVLADSSVSGERVPPPAAAAPGNVEQRIAEVVTFLPEGTTWAKLYLPTPPKGLVWKGDDLTSYALAQARLFGTVGAAAGPGMVEILGQRLPEEKAKGCIADLNLRSVYLVTCLTSRTRFTGLWDTTFGSMRLTQRGKRVTGTYTYNDGTIQGVVTGRVLRFIWLERTSGGRGSGRFTIADDGKSFSGEWNSGDDPDAGGSAWTGTRTPR